MSDAMFKKLLEASNGNVAMATIIDSSLDVVGHAGALYDAMKDGQDVSAQFASLGQSLERFVHMTGLKDALKERPNARV